MPVGDDKALAAAIQDVLDHPPPRTMLRERAEIFSTEQVAEHQIKLMFGDREAAYG